MKVTAETRSDWAVEPREIDLPQRAQVRGKYRARPLRHVVFKPTHEGATPLALPVDDVYTAYGIKNPLGPIGFDTAYSSRRSWGDLHWVSYFTWMGDKWEDRAAQSGKGGGE